MAKTEEQLKAERYWNQGSDRLEEMVKQLEGLVALLPDAKRGPINAMLQGPIGEQFTTAPASTRRSYHNAFPCGLLDHSLRVAGLALKLANTVWPGRWPNWKVAFVALFHDLGKAGGPGKPFYVQVAEAWKDRKGEFWEVSKDEYMPNPERAIFTLTSHGVPLDYEEYQAIRLNDGPGSDANADFAFKELPLSLVVQWADHAATLMEKEAERKDAGG